MQSSFLGNLTLVRSLTIPVAVLAAALAPVSGAQAWTLKTLHSFCSRANCTDGDGPLAGLVEDQAGALYGTTSFGGAYDRGVVFALSQGAAKWNYQVLESFCAQNQCVDGEVPYGRLVLDVNGNLYGTTEAGGAANCGTVFALKPNADRSKWRLRTLHSFCSTAGDAKFPQAGLTYAGAASGMLYDGASPLYGTASQGGTQDAGAVYAVAPNARNKWKEAVLHSFCAANGCADGQTPLGDLLLDRAGNLYGNTSLGGSAGRGVVFELSPNRRQTRWNETVLYSFCQLGGCVDGDKPLGHLLMDAGGTLFGTTANPGDQGLVFKLARKDRVWRESVLYSFCQLAGCTDGYTPTAGLIMDSSANLFGTTEFGGTSPVGAGTVFSLNRTEHTVLYNFCSDHNCTDGAFPQAPVIMNASGHLFGTTAGGVAGSYGTVFELSP